MNAFRSVGARLALALALVVAIALAIVYAIVVPSLERNLTQAKVNQLAGTAESLRSQFPAFEFQMQDFLDLASETANARVVWLRPLGATAPPLTVQGDSRAREPAGDIARDTIAVEASQTLVAARGIVVRDGERFAEVAIPVLYDGSVLLFSAPLDDTLANVQLVRERLLVAGTVALLVALLLGYGGSNVFARRVRRLERAADRIAGGELEVPVVDRGQDEVGQLARAFERMRKRLVKLEHARREFIANASHELRTPIFSLGGFLELLATEELDEETRREFLGTMQQQVDRLQKLATDLLDLSRLDAGQLMVELEPLELRSLAEALAEEFAAVSRSAEHALEVVVDGEPPPALGDELRVLQIGRGLVENAIRHTPRGTPVRIRVGGHGRRAVLAVEDAGAGIPPEHAEHVFERFYRIEGALASGSGLGLAIARELAELMDGTLELDSRPGRTALTLTLPAAAPVERREAEPALA